jgi:photosystem II stability/assembly factor-like uncharacterized protein
LAFKGAEISKPIQASWIAQNNVLYAGSHDALSKSSDQGLTFTHLKKFNCKGLDCVYVDKNGVLFVSPGIGAKHEECGVWQSSDTGISWVKTLTLPEFCSVWNIIEDQNGVMFTGVYTREKTKKAEIYRSQDNGKNWHRVFFDPKARHVHQVSVDTDTGYVYASVGDKSVAQSNIAYVIRSTDHGDSWHRILPKLPQVLALEVTNGARLFGTDDACNGQIYRTTDDITFHKVLETEGNAYCFWIRQNGLTGRLFASFVAGEANQKSAGIYVSEDKGFTWNQWRAFSADTAYDGSTRATNFAEGRLFFSLRLNGCRKCGVKIWDNIGGASRI